MRVSRYCQFSYVLGVFFCEKSNSSIISSKYMLGLETDKNFSYFNFLIFLLFIMCFLYSNISYIVFFFLDLKTGKDIESENIERRPPFSNCSVDSERLGKLFSHSFHKEHLSTLSLLCFHWFLFFPDVEKRVFILNKG